MGCIRDAITNRDRDMIIPLGTCKAIPGVLCLFLVRQDANRVQKKAMGVIKGLKNPPYVERSFDTVEEKAQGYCIVVFQYCKSSYREDNFCPLGSHTTRL